MKISNNWCTTCLQRDVTDGVQSVHMEVNHPDEINTLLTVPSFMQG
ncbi:MAG: hypothetical protein ACLUSV_08655 [Streptococcus sp.]